MKIYRSHNGLFLGVCRGLEESLGIPARYSRLVFIVLAIIFRAWIILGLYLLAAILMPVRSGENWRFQDNFEILSRDARQWSRKEYNEIKEMLRRASNSGTKYDFEEKTGEETSPQKPEPAAEATDETAEPSSKRSPKSKAGTSGKKSAGTAEKEDNKKV